MSYGLNRGSNILVRTPAPEATSTAPFVRLLARTDPPPNALVVTYEHTVSELAALWRTHHGALPAHLHVIAVRSPRRTAAPPPGVDPDTDVSSAVVAPDDLVALGTAIRERLAAWDAGGETALYFDSITRMLEHVPVETAFKFLHVATSQIRLADLTAYYALVASAHDDRTLSTLESLFDAVLD